MSEPNELAAALYHLAEVGRRGSVAIFRFRMLLAHPELAAWEDEMDNCYPNWPETR